MADIHQMNPALYKAAVEGKHEDYYVALRQTGAGDRVTPCGNTVLHVAALHGKTQFVENILEKVEDLLSSSMLLARNNKNETALHCAAERGYADVARAIINAAKNCKCPELGGVGVQKMMIGMRDDAKDTALHKAARMGHLDVVKLLVGADTEFEYDANAAGETPIYIAAEKPFQECLLEMLDKCKTPTYNGPLGRNALHALILSGISDSGPTSVFRILVFPFYWKNLVDTSVCTELLLRKEMPLCERKDEKGWTPLHYAVELRDHKTVGMILKENRSAAYIRAGKDGGEWTTIFHIAARDDNVKMMKCISESCPDCWDMVNSKSQNVFHEAAAGEKKRPAVIKYILNSPHVSRLVAQRDKDGNSPLHLLAISDYRILQTSRLKHNHLAFNNKNETPLDVALEHKERLFFHGVFQQGGKHVWSDSRIGRRGNFAEDPKKKSNTPEEDKHIETMIKSSDTNTIVATLILGLAFAAGFTIQGGKEDDTKQGFQQLLRNSAIMGFAIADTVAFVCSFLSIWFHIWLLLSAASSSRKYRNIVKIYTMEAVLLSSAFGAVVATFLYGMYAALDPFPTLANAVIALTVTIFFITVLVSIYETIVNFYLRFSDSL